MTMVQDPRTAQHDGMPRSAIASGSADYVLPAEQMADALLTYVQHACRGAAPATRRCRRRRPTRWRAWWRCCSERTKFDFSGYKNGHPAAAHPTPHEPAARRRACPRTWSCCAATRPRLTALSKDLLINVTSFFREPAAWQMLQERVIRPLGRREGRGRPTARLGARLRHAARKRTRSRWC